MNVGTMRNMKPITKYRLVRIGGNLCLTVAAVVALMTIAVPDDGPAPSMRRTFMTVLLCVAPLSLTGVWLRHRSTGLKDQAQMASYVAELGNRNSTRTENDATDPLH